jgi:hypothetical protein
MALLSMSAFSKRTMAALPFASFRKRLPARSASLQQQQQQQRQAGLRKPLCCAETHCLHA